MRGTRVLSYFFREKQSGFTLVEMIAVMMITSILAVTLSVRFSATDIDLQSAKSDVLAALIFARETAMARSDGNSAITVVIATNSIDVQVNGESFSSPFQSYPLTFPPAITVDNGIGILSFSTIGETETYSIHLVQDEFLEIINVSGVGYAY